MFFVLGRLTPPVLFWLVAALSVRAMAAASAMPSAGHDRPPALWPRAEARGHAARLDGDDAPRLGTFRPVDRLELHLCAF